MLKYNKVVLVAFLTNNYMKRKFKHWSSHTIQRFPISTKQTTTFSFHFKSMKTKKTYNVYVAIGTCMSRQTRGSQEPVSLTWLSPLILVNGN
jgi:hypothetical protein